MNAQPTRGSAITETLVGLLALLPAYWAIDYLGRVQDIDRQATMAARNAAWQVTAERPDEQSKPHPLWHFRGNPLLAGDDAAAIRELPTNATQSLPGTGLAVESVAHGKRLPSVVSLGGLSAQMLALAPERLPTYRAQMNVKALLAGHTRDETIDLRAHAAISQGDWSAHSDEQYQDRTNQIVASEPVAVLTQPARWLGQFFIFEEGRYAQSTDFVPPSRITPR